MSRPMASMLQPTAQQEKMRFEHLADWLHWQENLHLREIELGLERCRKVAHALDVVVPAATIITIAGTNGKGSSVAMLEAILLAAGYRVGCYTSPHLQHYNERIRIDGVDASDESICHSFQRIDDARGDISLTYFEFGTLASLDLIKRSAVDIAILEVGLGGRLDAVNLVDADIALVTAIDIDHIEWLGSDRNIIAVEKAGIFRSEQAAVCSDLAAPASINDEAIRIGTSLSQLGKDFFYEAHNNHWDWRNADKHLKDLPKPALVGEFQLQNAAGVLQVIHQLEKRHSVSRKAIDKGLSIAQAKGRYQQFDVAGINYILDVAHNPQAAKVMSDNLQNRKIPGKTHVLLGMLKDKDCAGVVGCLTDVIDTWCVTSLPGARGSSSKRLISQIHKSGIDVPMQAFNDFDSAFYHIENQVVAGDRVVVMGSFLTVSAALQFFKI